MGSPEIHLISKVVFLAIFKTKLHIDFPNKTRIFPVKRAALSANVSSALNTLLRGVNSL